MSKTTKSKAADRIAALLDESSFVEIGSLVTARSTDFNLTEEKAASDGVITGYGLIDGNLVYVYSQDASVLGGSIGEMHAKKIVRLYSLAMKMGAPVIGLLDSAGMRLQESADALNAFGMLYRRMAFASGVIPQITAVLGKCGGSLAVAAGMSDFVFMEGESAKLYVNSPNALEGNKEEDTAGAKFQSDKSGLADFVGTEEEKGNELAKEAHQLLKDCPDINFVGNIETREIPEGIVDVAVTDAFTGNAVLKMYEGVAKVILHELKDALMSSFVSKLGALMIKPALKGMIKTFDASAYGGAPMLGLRGLVVKTHGNSKASEIRNALEQCITFKEKNINDLFRTEMKLDEAAASRRKMKEQ